MGKGRRAGSDIAEGNFFGRIKFRAGALTVPGGNRGVPCTEAPYSKMRVRERGISIIVESMPLL